MVIRSRLGMQRPNPRNLAAPRTRAYRSAKCLMWCREQTQQPLKLPANVRASGSGRGVARGGYKEPGQLWSSSRAAGHRVTQVALTRFITARRGAYLPRPLPLPAPSAGTALGVHPGLSVYDHRYGPPLSFSGLCHTVVHCLSAPSLVTAVPPSCDPGPEGLALREAHLHHAVELAEVVDDVAVHVVDLAGAPR